MTRQHILHFNYCNYGSEVDNIIDADYNVIIIIVIA